MKGLFLYLGLIFSVSCSAGEQQQIAIIGAGYVGLVTGVSLAHINHKITIVDIDNKKIETLKKGEIPIYEPNLKELVFHNRDKIIFTTDIAEAISRAPIILIAVGTPTGENGKTDMSAFNAVLESIVQYATEPKIICIKSTVPMGTHKQTVQFFKDKGLPCELVSNPEFLREGTALRDFFEVNPIVLGSYSSEAINSMKKIYSPLLNAKEIVVIETDGPTAEVIKYAWNCFSAVRIAYVNELSHLCNRLDADIFTVVFGMSLSEKLLPTPHLKPGPGIGGSCLPKDIESFLHQSDALHSTFLLLKGVELSNQLHRERILNLIDTLIEENMSGKVITLLGLSYKPNTDDIRKSPAITVIEHCLERGAIVKAYDPQAMENMKELYPSVSYGDSVDEVLAESDLLIVLTDWQEFKELDLAMIRENMRDPRLLDTRNIWSMQQLRQAGFKAINLGRSE